MEALREMIAATEPYVGDDVATAAALRDNETFSHYERLVNAREQAKVALARMETDAHIDERSSSFSHERSSSSSNG